jgi:NAD(P)-dependent dehydrogenase (short-subunit alcohol dehydrogenase family)
MQDKICIVTGANSGIGKVTARELAKMGAAVVMVCRNQERGKTAQAEIKAASRNDSVDLMLADLSSQAAIRQLAQSFKEKYQQCDVLVNNAGALFMQRQLSKDGLEMTFALNHLGYFLLTNLLLDVIKASAPARIVNVSSEAHRGRKINFDDLQGEQSYSGYNAYGQSKLANILFTYELARRLEGSGVTVNCMHPGFVSSNFAKNNGLLARVALTLLRPFARSPKKGAETAVYLASSPQVEGISSSYFIDKQEATSSPESYDEAVAQRLWQVSMELTGLTETV